MPNPDPTPDAAAKMMSGQKLIDRVDALQHRVEELTSALAEAKKGEQFWINRDCEAREQLVEKDRRIEAMQSVVDAAVKEAHTVRAVVRAKGQSLIRLGEQLKMATFEKYAAVDAYLAARDAEVKPVMVDDSMYRLQRHREMCDRRDYRRSCSPSRDAEVKP